MNQIIEQKINAARMEVEKTEAPAERKDGLHAMLDHAHSCANGHPDKIVAIAEAMSYLIIHIVRSETREGERIALAIDRHSENCPGGRAPRTLKELGSRLAVQYPILTVLFVWTAAERGWLAAIWETLS